MFEQGEGHGGEAATNASKLAQTKVVEGRTIASVLSACDRSLKDADVRLTGLRITPALGGRAFFVVQGVQSDVEAALEAARAKLEAAETLEAYRADDAG